MNNVTPESDPVAWLWTVPWLAKQHRGVPVEVMVRGIAACGLQPALMIDGLQLYDGLAYAKLSEWLLIEAERLADLDQDHEQHDQPAADYLTLAQEFEPDTLFHMLLGEESEAERLNIAKAIAAVLGKKHHPVTHPGAAQFLKDLTGAANRDADATERARQWIDQHLATA